MTGAHGLALEKRGSVDDLNVVRNGASQTHAGECLPLAEIPAWWCGFLFHVLNPRQLCMYVYLTMLGNEDGLCHPTIEQIRKDLGLLSTTMVFESIAALEEHGFILRTRQSLPDSRSRRNVYRRTACEYTVLRLLELHKIDGDMHPTISGAAPASEESRQLVQEGLRAMLEDRYERYAAAPADQRRDVLIELLNEILRARDGGIYSKR